MLATGSLLSRSYERAFSILFTSFMFIVPIMLGCGCISFVKQVYSRLNFSERNKTMGPLSSSEAFFLAFLVGVLLLNLLLALGPIIPIWNLSIFLHVVLAISVLINLIYPFEVELDVTKGLAKDLVIMAGIAIFSSTLVLSKMVAAVQFPLSFGYPGPYVFTVRTLLDGSPLYYNSVSYLLNMHVMLGVAASLTAANPFGLIASSPFYYIPIFACSIYVVSRYSGVSRLISILIAGMSIFVIHSAMGTFLYFSERTLLLVLAPLFVLYTLKIGRRIPNKGVLLTNTLVAVFLLLVYSFLDPLTKLCFLLFSLPLISFITLSKYGIFACFDFLVMFSFGSIHIFEALPYMLIRVLLYWRAPKFMSFSSISNSLKSISKGLKIVLLVLILVISFAPAFGLWPVVDVLSLNVARLNIPGNLLAPYGFYNAFEAWQNWIVYTLSYWNYYLLLAFLLLYLLFARFIKRSVLLLFPSLLLVSILTIHTGEIFRYLDALGLFYVMALITAVSHLERSQRLNLTWLDAKMKMSFLTRAVRINVNTKKIILIALMLILATSSILYGLQRTSDYIYVNTTMQSEMTYEDLALADYLNTNFSSYRRYPSLPIEGTSQQPLEYRGPLVVSDPLTMSTLYFSTACEVFMRERPSPPFVEADYSVETIAELEQLKHDLLSTDVNSFLQSIDGYRESSRFNFSAVLLMLTPRMILWLESPNEFITESYYNLSLIGQLNTLVAKFLANQRFSLLQKINGDVYIVQIAN